MIARLSHELLYYVSLSDTHGNAFGEQHQHQPYIFVRSQVARRGGAVAHTLNGGMCILLGDRRLVQSARKCRECIAHHAKPALEDFRVRFRKLTDGADAVTAELALCGVAHIQKVTHRQRVDNLFISIRLDDRYGIGLFIIAAEFRGNFVERNTNGNGDTQFTLYNKSHIDDFLSHNRINHSEEDFVLVKGNFEPIVSEALWETCNQIRSKRAAFVKGKDGRAHKFGVSFPQNKWTKILFCDCGMRFQIEGYDKTANGGKNMRLICARSKMFKKKDAARALNGIPCPAPYASEWKLELMAREVFRTVWKENAEDILGLLRMLDANLNTTGTPNDGNQLENKLSALNEELDDLVSQRASRSITMDDFLSRSTEINNEIINVEGLLQSSIQEQRPKARLDMHSIEAALSDDASFPDGKIEPGFLDRYANRIVKSNNRYIWMLQLVNVQQIMPIQSERQPIAMVTYKSGVPYDIEQEQTGKQDKESAGPDCATICRPQDFFLNMSRTKRKRKLVEWLESCQENQVNVLDEKIPLLSFAVDFVTAYEYQKARGIKIHPGLWKDMRVDIFLVKKEN